MEKKNKIIEAVILAVGLILLGLCIKGGMDNFTNKDRRVTVKGLAEVEMPADKVTWPIVLKEVGNDLPTLYNRIKSINNTVKEFLTSSGISESEISINAPQVIDLTAERYSSYDVRYRYNITTVITVTSSKVDLVRSIMDRQGELLKDGIAIVDGGYDAPRTSYEFTAFQEAKSTMMEEAIKNAQVTANQFAESSNSKLGPIVSATQGQFSIEDRDMNTPYIKKLRVVTTITYALN